MLKIIENFFTEDECKSAVNDVLKNRERWYQCPWTSMYILGNSLFRKISFNESASTINYGNYFNSSYFDSPSLHLFKNKLEKKFNKVEFIEGLSRPGFQIIKLNENLKPSVWHYDNMITCYPFENFFQNYTGNFNEFFEEKKIFTLLLSDGNFSFDYYPETISEFGKDFFESRDIAPHCQSHRNLVGDECPNTECNLKKYQTVIYKKGSLLIQDERFLHRVGIKDLNGSDNLRITLQGYGLIRNKILYLVW